jgi:hypothetical protein
MEEDQLREVLSQLGTATGALLNGLRLLIQAWQTGDQDLAVDVAGQLAGAANALGQVETALGTSFGILF